MPHVFLVHAVLEIGKSKTTAQRAVDSIIYGKAAVWENRIRLEKYRRLRDFHQKEGEIQGGSSRSRREKTT